MSQNEKVAEAKKLTREDVLAASARKTDELVVPELGGVIPIASLTAWEEHEWQQAVMSFDYDGRGKVSVRQTKESANILLVALGVRNGNGEPWFSYDEAKALNPGVVKRLADGIRRLSSMDVSVEDAKGN
jgi:hypothetical protein